MMNRFEQSAAAELFRWPEGMPPDDPYTGPGPGDSPDVVRLIAAVVRSIPLRTIRLPDAFFPAHLPAAIIDAVFHCRSLREKHLVSYSERFCRHFHIARTRVDSWNFPPPEAQETLESLLRRYARLGATGMANTVLQDLQPFPGTRIMRASYVQRVARELRRIGVDVLQDLTVRQRRNVLGAIRRLPGDSTVLSRLFLMYTGGDNFVWPDARVRCFVAQSVGRQSIEASRAAALVRQCAHELLLSPRFLDYGIWIRGADSATIG